MKMQMQTPAAMVSPAIGESHRKTLWRERTTDDVRVRSMTGLVLAGCVLLIAVFAVAWIGLPRFWFVWVPFLAFAVAFFALMVVMLWPSVFFDDQGLIQVEEVTQRDINGDGYIGESPKPDRVLVTLNIVNEHHNSVRVHDIPLTYGLRHFIQEYLHDLEQNGVTNARFGEKIARQYGAEPEFVEMRNLFIARGLAAWKNDEHHEAGTWPRRGFESALRELATTPLPGEEGYQKWAKRHGMARHGTQRGGVVR